MEPILSLSPQQFRAALAELQLDPQREAMLVEQYNAANAPQQGGRDRGMLRNLLDNIIGFDDEVVTPGERLGAGVEQFAGGLLSDPLGTGAGILQGGYETIERAMAPGATPMDVMGAAGMAMGAGGLLGRAPQDAVGMFAGQRSRTADLDALSRARELSARRRSPEEIWSETGWFKGADGMWRYEIDDSMAILRQGPSDALNYGRQPYQTNYGGAILHQPLLGGSFRGVNYEPAYDFMGDVDFKRSDQPSGWHDRDTSAINVQAASSQEGLPITLHELQHAVQAKEGFAVGSNPQFERSVLEAQGGNFPSDAAFQNYLRTAGEVEANNVMNRRSMTADQRRETPPWVTQDFPYSEQIVRLPNDPLANLRAYIAAAGGVLPR